MNVAKHSCLLTCCACERVLCSCSELVRLDVETKIRCAIADRATIRAHACPGQALTVSCGRSDALKITFFTVRSEQKDGAVLAVRVDSQCLLLAQSVETFFFI